MNEMVIEPSDTDSDDESDNDEDLLDDDDRQLIGQTLQQSTSTDSPSTSNSMYKHKT